MNPKRKKRLILAGLIVGGVAIAVGLVLMAMRENINHFYSPSQVASGEAPHNHTFRLGGLVEKGTVQREKDGLTVHFTVTDTAVATKVVYTGILPDLFREGQGIIALGKLGSNGVFKADEVLAKHDEKYMPPEVASALKTAQGKTAMKHPEAGI